MYLNIDTNPIVGEILDVERVLEDKKDSMMSGYVSLETLTKLIPKILMFLFNQSLFRFGKELYEKFKKTE